MKTPGMSQQIAALSRMADTRWFALFMEQGTGKTWTFLADAESLFHKGKIDSACVLAPSGVHENWVLREIPIHLGVKHVAGFWRANMGKRVMEKLERDLFTHQKDGQMRILAMNYEAVARSKKAFEFLSRFMRETRCLFILDESQRIKNTKTGTFKKVMEISHLAVARRIGTGTPMDKPDDIFGQYEFLKSGLLGTKNFRAFMGEYAVLADANNPQRQSDWSFRRQIEGNPRLAWSIQVARDDDTGRPMYRNLDRLNKLIAPHCYRVLKKDCLDLPPKVYTNHYFDLTPEQRAAYELLEEELRIEAHDGTLTTVHKLAKFVKLQQITSGYVFIPGVEEPKYIGDKNPRLLAIADKLEDLPGQKIIWARFREEIKALGMLLHDLKIPFVEYHGQVLKSERNYAIDRFQGGDAQVFLGVQKAGGTGLTLTAASSTIFCSNEFSALVRAQAEDRNHRKGSEIHESVLYIDVMAQDSIDESIAAAHQFKTSLAARVLGDRGIDMRGVGLD